MKRLIVGLGEALWDMLPEGKKIGGAPANFAYHAAQFGMDTMAVSALGDDALGDEIAQKFAEKKLNVLMPRVPFPTGTVKVCPPTTLRKMWLGTTSPSRPNLKKWPETAVPCAGDHWPNATK